MRNFVFPDPSLRPYARRFVWLALDTEREGNAPITEKLAVRVLPTLYVLEPASERAVLAWPGSLTAGELAALLDDAEVAANRRDPGSEAVASLLRGRQATAAASHDEAIAAYRAALAQAPAGWARRPFVVDGLVTELQAAGQFASCTTMGADEGPQMPPGSALADVLRAALGCAAELPKQAPERARLAALVALGERVATDGSQPILADDRSDLYDYVIAGLRSTGRAEDAKRLAGQWVGMLEAEAARAPTPAARSVFDAHRLLAYIAIGEPLRAVPMLQLSERDFPSDYDPPARLATAYLEAKRYDDALAAVGRALALAYGPRKLRLWLLQANIYEAKGDRAAEARALRAALDFAKTVPLPESYPKLRDLIEKRLSQMKR
jgi:tetratricopeptide (TPR) repeat protein